MYIIRKMRRLRTEKVGLKLFGVGYVFPWFS